MNGETPRPERLSVEQIREMLAKATPGPWRWGSDAALGAGEYAFDEVIEPRVNCMAYCYGGSAVLDISDADRALLAAAPELAERVIEAEAEVERLRKALEPFAAFHNRSMAARNPRMSDDLGVATIQNNIEGDASITVGHLRAAVAALADEGSRPAAGPYEVGGEP